MWDLLQENADLSEPGLARWFVSPRLGGGEAPARGASALAVLHRCQNCQSQGAKVLVNVTVKYIKRPKK